MRVARGRVSPLQIMYLDNLDIENNSSPSLAFRIPSILSSPSFTTASSSLFPSSIRSTTQRHLASSAPISAMSSSIRFCRLWCDAVSASARERDASTFKKEEMGGGGMLGLACGCGEDRDWKRVLESVVTEVSGAVSVSVMDIFSCDADISILPAFVSCRMRRIVFRDVQADSTSNGN